MLRFPDLVDFSVSAKGDQIGIWQAPGTSGETLRHLLLDQLLPRLLAHGGRLVLHAGAVRVDGRAIAFVGETGAGKSTLTASFHAAGHPLLSDDGLVLTQAAGCVTALPTYRSLRLWPDALARLYAETPLLAPMAHYSAKQRVIIGEAPETISHPMPLAALYVLAPHADTAVSTISLTRLSPRDACMAIIGNSFKLDVNDMRRAADLTAAAGRIAQQVPAFTLEYPRNFGLLPTVRTAVLQYVA